MIQLQDTFADEKAVHLLLDFQSANLATEAAEADTGAASVTRPSLLSPDSGNSGSSGLDSGIGSESTLASRSASIASGPLTSPLAPTSSAPDLLPPGNGSGGSGSDSRHGSSLSSLPSASASVSVSPSPSPSRDISLASAGLDRLLPVLRLAHRYEFPVQGEILLAITEALGSSRTSAPETLATFVTASELGSPDLAHAAVRAMVRGDARSYCPLGWDAGTFAAVPKEYHWALQRCFVPSTEDGGLLGSVQIDEERFVPALFEYRAVTSQQGGAQN